MGLDQNIVKVGYDRISRTWRTVRDDDWYFRKFYPLHEWIVANCLCDAGDKEIDEYGFLNGVINTEGCDNCVLIPIKLDKWKELLSILNALRKAWKNVPDTVKEAVDNIENDSDVDSKEYTAFKELAEKTFPVSDWHYSRWDRYDSSYMWYVDRLHEYAKEICSLHHGPDGLIPGDDPIDEATLERLRNKYADREKVTLIREAEVEKALKEAAENNCTDEEKNDTFAVCNNRAASEEYWAHMKQWDAEHGYNANNDEAIAEMCRLAGAEDCRYDRYAYAYDPWY